MRTNYGICIRVWVYRPMLRYICYYSTLMTAFLQVKKHRNTPQACLRTTSPALRATSPCRGGFGSPRKVNGFARGSPTRGAVERSETERLYEGKPDHRCAAALSCRACPLRHCFAMPPLPKGEALAGRATSYWTPEARYGAKARASLTGPAASGQRTLSSCREPGQRSTTVSEISCFARPA